MFAALSFSVASMLQGGDPGVISEEKAKLAADEILSYGQNLRNAVASLQISNGCSDTDISFTRTAGDVYEHASEKAECQVFNTSGGAVSYNDPNPDYLDPAFNSETLYNTWYFTGYTCIEDVGGAESGCHVDGIDNSELMMYLPYISEQICLEINRRVTNSATAPGDPNSVWTAAETKFTGVYSETGRRLEYGGTRLAGCFKSTGGAGTEPPPNSHVFFQVLIAR